MGKINSILTPWFNSWKRPEAAFSDFADELGVTETDYVVNKRGFSAFFGTDLDLQLRRRGIDTIVLGEFLLMQAWIQQLVTPINTAMTNTS